MHVSFNCRIVMDRDRVNIVLTPVFSSYFYYFCCCVCACVCSQSERSCSSRFNQRVYHCVFFSLFSLFVSLLHALLLSFFFSSFFFLLLDLFVCVRVFRRMKTNTMYLMFIFFLVWFALSFFSLIIYLLI